MHLRCSSRGPLATIYHFKLIYSYLFDFVVALRPGQKKEIKVTFTPYEAKVIVQTAVISFKDGDLNH